MFQCHVDNVIMGTLIDFSSDGSPRAVRLWDIRARRTRCTDSHFVNSIERDIHELLKIYIFHVIPRSITKTGQREGIKGDKISL